MSSFAYLNQYKSIMIFTELCNNVFNKAITDYHNGRTNMLDYLVGQVMKKSKGKANPVEAKSKMLEKIK